jgi:thiol-disulfide isomerase/thioredoxin
LAGGLLTGAALGMVWAPCAGPVLAAITTLAATRQVTLASLGVTAAYGLGIGIPLLVVAYGGRRIIRHIPPLARHASGLQRGFGMLMMGTALLMALGADTALTASLTGALPAGWNDRLQAFEDAPLARAQIDRLVGRAPGLTMASSEAELGATTQSAVPGSAVSGMSMPARSGTTPSGPAGATVRPEASKLPSKAPFPSPQGAPAAVARAAAQPAATSTPSAPMLDLPDGGPAPDFKGLANWQNSAPLTLAGLRGKVVLVDFWTFSCINCIHTLPYVTAWDARYRDQGLVVVGVHSPEFAFERETSNVQQAIAQYGIKYPVAQDNDFATWNAFGNRYWPAEYFIDARGHLRHVHFGEGEYDQSEQIIRQLLAEAGQSAK